ncbi:uncharacterized protein Bfra_009303 [Botrytis fragariae]|uniref:Uncharacterized protein n=1 Tax=Botrytis fragariae TaxID=1964551 RepID=A0A8H6EG74_9HELO|nr:uncharacterized protein Bfra_009303 [Botrytis fragariae]KAF5870750.1 hypothetical protein Bfra_009303 [Botrytis fragariae]
MTSSDPQGKGKGKAPNPSSASTSSTFTAPTRTTSNDTPSRQDEQPTPSLLNRIGASAAGLSRDVFAGGSAVGGESLRRDARGFLAAAGNGKGGSTSASGNENGDVGYTQMHTGNLGLLDGSSSISGGVGDTLGMRSAGNMRTSGSGSGIQGAGGSGNLDGNTVEGSERARWIQQNEKEFAEFLDGVPSLTTAGDAGFEGGYMESTYEMHTNDSQTAQAGKFQYGAPLNPVGKQAFEDSWARSAQEVTGQHEAHPGPHAVNTREPTIYHFEPLPAFNPDKVTAAEYRREVVNTTARRDAGYMNTGHHNISVQEQESRDGDEVRDLLSRIGGFSFDEEIAGLSETEIERDEMKAYEREWMGMSSMERDRIIQVTRDLFPEKVKDGRGGLHGGIDVENPLNLFPGHEREAEENWREEKEREMQREEEDDDDDDDEFEGEVLNFQGTEWRVRKEKKNGEIKKGMRGKAKEEWKSDWEGVLKGYTDEVWGGLIPLVREAREELKVEEEKGDGGEGKETGNLKALRRLGAVLGHLRGLDGSGKQGWGC